VRLGVREGNKIQIESGVNPGEDVVIVGGLGVDDKQKVKIINATVEEAPDEIPDAEPAAGKDQKPGSDQKKDEAKPKAK